MSTIITYSLSSGVIFMVIIVAIFMSLTLQIIMENRNNGCLEQEDIASLIDERLKIHEFDTAMILMEKQNLKKLEIQEVELRARMKEGLS